MKIRLLLFVLATILLATLGPASAQQPASSPAPQTDTTARSLVGKWEPVSQVSLMSKETIEFKADGTLSQSAQPSGAAGLSMKMGGTYKLDGDKVTLKVVSLQVAPAPDASDAIKTQAEAMNKQVTPEMIAKLPGMTGTLKWDGNDSFTIISQGRPLVFNRVGSAKALAAEAAAEAAILKPPTPPTPTIAGRPSTPAPTSKTKVKAAPSGSSLTGSWEVHVHGMRQGNIVVDDAELTFDLAQSGPYVNGSATGKQPISGWIKNSIITLKQKMETSGGPASYIVFTGKLVKPGVMKGAVRFPGQSTITWEATRTGS